MALFTPIKVLQIRNSSVLTNFGQIREFVRSSLIKGIPVALKGHFKTFHRSQFSTFFNIFQIFLLNRQVKAWSTIRSISGLALIFLKMAKIGINRKNHTSETRIVANLHGKQNFLLGQNVLTGSQNVLKQVSVPFNAPLCPN